MKNFLINLVTFLFILVPTASVAEGTITIDRSSDSAAEAHLSANLFGAAVGAALKKGNFKVHDITVHLTVDPSSADGQYRLVWSCKLRKALASEAPDQYFDTRGAMMPGEDAKEAKAAAEKKIATENRIGNTRAAFLKAYGNVNIPAKGGVQTACSTDRGAKGQSRNGEVWCLQTAFLIATAKKAATP